MTLTTQHDLAWVTCRQHLVTVEAEVRDKNQLTLPKPLAKAMNVQVGDRLIFVFDECEPAVVQVHRAPEDYAGALAGVFGTPDEVKTYLQGEHEAWGE